MSYLPDIEQHLIGLLLNKPETYADLTLLAIKDFEQVRRPIFSVIKQQLDTAPQGSVEPVILVEKLRSYGVTKVGEVDVLDYLEALQRRGKLIEPKRATELLKELKTATVKRELIEACREAERKIEKAGKLEEITTAVDQTISAVRTNVFQVNETINLFSDMEAKIEEEGNNPLKDGEMVGPIGPFPSITATIGSLSYRGAWVTVGARTNQGKSSLSWYYNMLTSEKSGVPVLTLDAAEMTPDEIQYRTICALSGGEIPYSELEHRRWRRNPNWVKMIREDIWPRIRKMDKLGTAHYYNIGTMKPQEIISFIKRFYYNKIGRGNPLLINFDYIKSMGAFEKQFSEHKVIGDFVNDFKTLITEEIHASVWAGVQNNRSGIAAPGQKEDHVEHDGQMGLSDRIIQQSTHGFILRYKTPEEISREKNLFGNLRFVCVKKRKLTGPRYQELLFPVKSGNRFVQNYFNLESRGFSYIDKGSFKDMTEKLGHVPIDMTTDGASKEMP
jgi:hypothetical protein